MYDDVYTISFFKLQTLISCFSLRTVKLEKDIVAMRAVCTSQFLPPEGEVLGYMGKTFVSDFLDFLGMS